MMFNKIKGYCKANYKVFLIIGVVFAWLASYQAWVIHIRNSEQVVKSSFVTVSHVKITDFDYLSYGHGNRAKKSYCYVSFDLNSRHYTNMLIVGSNMDKNNYPVAYHGLLNNIKFINLYDYPFSEDIDFGVGEAVYPKLSEVLFYKHERGIKRGFYALKTNKYLPSIDWQLKHNEVCLVGNR